MLSTMESSEAEGELSYIQGLQIRTLTESVRGRPGALSLIAVATVLYFGSYEIEAGWVPVVAPVVWILFIVGWVRWLRSSNRVRGGRRATWVWRRDGPLYVGLFVAANLIGLVGASVSWLLAGALMASLGTVAGLIERAIWPR